MQATNLREFLENPGQFTTLHLTNIPIELAEAEAIAGALKINTTLTDLDLDLNHIGAAGAEKIAEALKINTTLTGIYLHHNKIDDLGAEAIAAALKENTTLTSLDLDHNEIGDLGIEKIDNIVRNNIIKLTALKESLLFKLNNLDLDITNSTKSFNDNINESFINLTEENSVLRKAAIFLHEKYSANLLKHILSTNIFTNTSINLPADQLDGLINTLDQHQKYNMIALQGIAKNLSKIGLSVEIWAKIFSYLEPGDIKFSAGQSIELLESIMDP